MPSFITRHTWALRPGERAPALRRSCSTRPVGPPSPAPPCQSHFLSCSVHPSLHVMGCRSSLWGWKAVPSSMGSCSVRLWVYLLAEQLDAQRKVLEEPLRGRHWPLSTPRPFLGFTCSPLFHLHHRLCRPPLTQRREAAAGLPVSQTCRRVRWQAEPSVGTSVRRAGAPVFSGIAVGLGGPRLERLCEPQVGLQTAPP